MNMNEIGSVIAWGTCISIGVPMLVIGLFHLLAPKAAWRLYRAGGKLWGSDPADIAPEYKSGAAMRLVAVVLTLGGGFICLIPKLFVG